jgi:hypothetical protein
MWEQMPWQLGERRLCRYLPQIESTLAFYVQPALVPKMIFLWHLPGRFTSERRSHFPQNTCAEYLLAVLCSRYAQQQPRHPGGRGMSIRIRHTFQ